MTSENTIKDVSNKTIKYSKKWFNPLFFILRDIQATKPNVNKIFVYGSKSSAKTFTIGQFIEIECLKGLSAIAYRKESARINDTIKKSFSSALKYTRLSNAYTIMDKQYRNIVGGEIVMRGLDSESKVKGLEGYSYLLFDELDHFTQWIDSCCAVDATAWHTNSSVYYSYTEWCRSNGINHPKSLDVLCQSLAKRGYKTSIQRRKANGARPRGVEGLKNL